MAYHWSTNCASTATRIASCAGTELYLFQRMRYNKCLKRGYGFMNVKTFLISIIAETLFAGLITVLSDAVTLQYAIINGAFLAGLIFALLGVFLHGVNMDWFAYLHTFFPTRIPQNRLTRWKWTPRRRTDVKIPNITALP